MNNMRVVPKSRQVLHLKKRGKTNKIPTEGLMASGVVKFRLPYFGQKEGFLEKILSPQSGASVIKYYLIKRRVNGSKRFLLIRIYGGKEAIKGIAGKRDALFFCKIHLSATKNLREHVSIHLEHCTDETVTVTHALEFLYTTKEIGTRDTFTTVDMDGIVVRFRKLTT